MEQKYYLHQKKRDGLVHLVLDSLDNYKILSERMNVLTIYLPFRKLPVASDLRKVKTAVRVRVLSYGTISCCLILFYISRDILHVIYYAY